MVALAAVAVCGAMDDADIAAAIGGLVTLAKGVVKWYRGEKRGWEEFGVGLLVWCTEVQTGVQFLKLLKLESGAVLLSEELYENFDQHYRCERTTRGTHHFHTMEFETSVAGACFANDAEALEFAKKMPIMAPKPAKKLDPKEAKRLEAEHAKEEREREKREEKERKEREKQEKKERKEKEKAAKKAAKGGGSADPGREMVIGMPTNFKHVTHIGWDETHGFQVCAWHARTCTPCMHTRLPGPRRAAARLPTQPARALTPDPRPHPHPGATQPCGPRLAGQQPASGVEGTLQGGGCEEA